MSTTGYEIARLPSGIPGLDGVLNGGLPQRRLSLVTGTAGTGKTLFGVQFLAAGIARHDEAGVFVTFEERPAAIRRNFRSFGWDVATWEDEGRWRFVDASPQPEEETVVAGEFDLSSLVVRVKHAVSESGARRVAIDSTGSLVEQFASPFAARRALFQIAAELQDMGVTSVMTAERADDYGPITKYGFEEFVSDNVVILRNSLEGEKRRRTIEVLKLRGGSHLKGEHLFTIQPAHGLIVVPQETIDIEYEASGTRLTTGLPELDEMCRGGYYDKSLILVTGATGTGKSLMASHFIAGGVANGERALLLSFEESRAQLIRNASRWGLDFEQMEADGMLRLVAAAPEAASLEDHLLRMKEEVRTFAPDRVAIDSLTALQRISTARSFREYLLGLTFHIKTHALVGLMTAATEDIAGAGLVSGELHISTVSDTIVVLQYIGRESAISRGVAVLKMRGSDHDKSLREYTIDDAGMHIGEPVPLRTWTRLPEVL
ncbi:MAG TPA: circadian clock protein KaiC [Solirubrobacteraceae bacterium]|nr:circadian clock protein KaiC [Solirubrobacteraceae bacterium]